jgi:hypothetical protein
MEEAALNDVLKNANVKRAVVLGSSMQRFVLMSKESFEGDGLLNKLRDDYRKSFQGSTLVTKLSTNMFICQQHVRLRI